jgi:hypothetical protein
MQRCKNIAEKLQCGQQDDQVLLFTLNQVYRLG